MATTKENKMTIEQMVASMKARNAERGLGVRCPTCNAGIGKFCLKEGVSTHRNADDIVVHPARVALFREQTR